MNTKQVVTGIWIALLTTSLAAQETTQPLPAAAAPTVTYIANEGFLIEAAGKKVLVDSLFDAAYGNLAPSQEVLDKPGYWVDAATIPALRSTANPAQENPK